MVFTIDERLGILAHAAMHDFVIVPAFAAANIVAYSRNHWRALPAAAGRRQLELAVDDRNDSAGGSFATHANAFAALSRCREPSPSTPSE